MEYASVEDVEKRCRRELTGDEKSLCRALLEDAGVMIDSRNNKASEAAKRLVSCNMVLRAIGDGGTAQGPLGATQGTISALGYSQSWTMQGGSVGELYFSKTDKNLLGIGRRIGFVGGLPQEEGTDD